MDELFRKTLDVSIIICTCNRAKFLEKALDSLLTIKTKCVYEVVVVDNNSTDETKAVVSSLQQTFPAPLRYTFEPRQGLSHARNAGIQVAKGGIVAFTDDDAAVRDDWLVALWECFQKTGCDALGGCIIPLYPERTPRWIKDCADLITGPVLSHDYGRQIQPYDLAHMKPFVGANIAFRKSIFDECGFFRVDIGAGQGAMGEDTELFKRLTRNKKTIVYCGSAVVFHPVEPNRMTFPYIAKWKIAFGRHLVITDDESLSMGSLIYYGGIPRYCLRIVMKSIFSLGMNLFRRRKFLKAWNNLFIHLGIMMESRKQYRQSTHRDIRQEMRNFVKTMGCFFVYYTGIVHLYLITIFLRRKNFPAVIIDFHSFNNHPDNGVDPGAAVNLTEQQFQALLVFIERHFQIVSFDQVVETLARGQSFPRPTVAFSVDDGFRDNYTVMFPILKAKNLTATVFLTAGYIGTNQTLWFERLLKGVARTEKKTIAFLIHSDRSFRCFLDSPHNKQASYLRLCVYLKGLPLDQRDRQLAVIERLLQAPIPEKSDMLDWDQAKEMQEEGITFGAHTMTHPILSRMPIEEAKKEILDSKQTIERHLGCRVRHFAIPNGGPDDFNEDLTDYCRTIGLESVSSTIFGANEGPQAQWPLRRICPCLPLSTFAVYLIKAFRTR